MVKKILSGVLAVVVLFSLASGLLPVHADVISSSSAETDIIKYDRFFIGVGDEYAFELQFDVDYYYITTMNSNIVSVNVSDGLYTICGVAPGTTGILVNYSIDGVFNSHYCVIDVFDNFINTYQKPYNSEEFFIYNAPENALLTANISNLTVDVSAWENSNSFYVYWRIVGGSGGYYFISMPLLNVFLNSENGQVKICTSLDETPQPWRILVNFDGNPVLVPSGLEHTNTALVTNGTDIYLADYYNTAYSHEWQIVQKTFYIDNYYDSSYNLSQDVITNANEFVRDYAFGGTGFSLDFSDSITRRTDLLADQCPNGNNAPCDENCVIYHKYDVNILLNLYNEANRDANHISFLWSDRPPNVYYDYIVNDKIVFGSQLVTIKTKDNITQRMHWPVASCYILSIHSESLAAIILAHEIAHALYMYEAYEKDETHREYFDIRCIMNPVDLSSIEDLYDDIINYNIDPFCSTCYDYLCERANNVLYIHGYEEINEIYEITED